MPLTTDILLNIEKLSLAYADHLVLEDVALQACRGELIALIGANGSGKSTLMHAIAGNIKAQMGKVELMGKRIQEYPARQLARHLSFVRPVPITVPYMTVSELALTGRFPYLGLLAGPGAEDHAKVREALNQLGIEHLKNRQLDQLSDGEKQKAQIARALVQDTPLMLLDEPAAHIDLPGRHEISSLLTRLCRQYGKTIIYSSHDLDIALQAADTLWVVDQGRVHSGSPEDLALSGLFNRLFERQGMEFHPEDGRFSLPWQQPSLKVQVSGPAPHLRWAMRLMHRLGWAISNDAHNQLTVLKESGDNICYQWKNPEKEKRFDSLRQLQAWLDENYQ